MYWKPLCFKNIEVHSDLNSLSKSSATIVVVLLKNEGAVVVCSVISFLGVSTLDGTLFNSIGFTKSPPGGLGPIRGGASGIMPFFLS